MQSEVISNPSKCHSLRARAGVLVAAALTFLTQMTPARAGTTASRVLGQEDFTHSAYNSLGANLLSVGGTAAATAVDKSSTPNRLYVTDYNNHRVLGYSSITALTNGANADLVIGQPDFFASGCSGGATNFCYPRGVAVDSNGNLYVSDNYHNRVLVFSNPFAIKASTGRTGGFAASMVLGQGGSYGSGACNVGGTQPTASTLCGPIGVTVDSSNNLYVADFSNNRVLEFTNPLATGSLSAHLVFGQTTFTANGANQGGTPAKTTLYGPAAVAVDTNNNVYVADYNNNRVLFYTTPLSTDTIADQVWGQGGSFTTNTCNVGSASAITLCNPGGVALDSANNLYIADLGNHRVLEYNETTNPPNSRTANLAFGQANTTSFLGCNQSVATSASGLCYPSGVSVDAANDLFVLDGYNNRALEYFTPLSASGGGTGDTAPDVVLGQLDFTHNSPNTVDAASLYNPLQAALDKNAAPNHLYLADRYNHRVLGWQNAATFTNGAPADLVIGQADFQSGNCNSGTFGSNRLCTPTGVAVGAGGNLYVADYSNNRVLEFTNPFAACASFPCVGGTANKIFGQPSAIVNSCNNGGLGAASLCNPARVAVDSVGNLYVSDQSNHRVLEYNTPLTSTAVTGSGDTTADLVFGQGATGKGTEFTTNGCNQGVLGGHSLCTPNGVATDSANNVYVADQSNNRVLEFDEPTNATTAPNNVVATTVFGQPGASFTVNGCDNPALNADSLCSPTALNLDSANNLLIGDQGNDRVLEYFTPLADPFNPDTTADIVWGQGGSFRSNACNLGGTRPSAGTLCHAEDPLVDGAGRVFITDRDNNRVLLFNPPFTAPGFLVAAQATVPGGVISVRPTTLAFGSVVVGKQGRPRRLTIRNEGDTPVQVDDISAAAGEFIVGGTCGGVIPAGGVCTVSVTFKPLTAGKRGGQLLISNNALNSPHAVRLRGRARAKKR